MMRLRGYAIAAALACAALAACASSSAVTPTTESAVALRDLATVQSHDLIAFKARIDPQIRRKAGDAQFAKIADIYPRTPPGENRLVWRDKRSAHGETRLYFAFETQYSQRWVLTNMQYAQRSDKLVFTGIYARPMSQSLEQKNAFFRANIPLSNLAMLAIACFDAAFVLGTLVVAVRLETRQSRIWGLASVIGIGRLIVNWTSGEMRLQPIFIAAPSAALSEVAPHGPQAFGDYATYPWQLSISLPIGAIAYWVWRAARRAPEPNPGVSESSAISPSRAQR